ncbi:MAG: hypothetical protein EBT05_19075, partial [Betaproteobacteria bacterium]|nr:hypothetical protein [Betaproteobacteria bacterium]
MTHDSCLINLAYAQKLKGDLMPTVFTTAQREAYEKDGFVMIPSLFDAEEISLMRQAMEQDPALKQSLYERRDAQGKAT